MPINEEEEDNEKSVILYLSAIESKMIQIIHAYGLVLANVKDLFTICNK